jgi:hypothetical protein
MKRFLLLVLAVIVQTATAQTVLETNPSSLHWNQIQTPNFRIVFPEGFEFQAQRMANTFEHIREAEAGTMGGVPRPISVILQNQSSESNGFVSMFPRRSEFFTMPSQNYNFTGTNDWLNLLASHEYRHVVQYQNANRGFNKWLYYIFGSPVFTGMAHAAAPDWFWEGDAVATETAFTPGGRGKIPNFGLLMRTNLQTGRLFNYHKQYLQSYKHNIPNHYVLGYHMVSYLRQRTNDPEIWEKISARAWRVPFIPFAFSNAIKKESGLSVTRLYEEMASDLATRWHQESDTLTLTRFQRVNNRTTKAYTDYLYPQPLADGSVVVMKEGIGDIATFCLLKNGVEEKLFTPGFMNDTGMLSVNEAGIFWSEYGFDPRWQVRNYSLLKGFSFKSGNRLTVSEKQARLAGAAISPDSRFVVTVESSNEYWHRVMVLSYPRGKEEKVFSNLENYFYSMPRWSDDGKRIVVCKTTPQGKTISIIDFATGHEEDVLPISNENTGHPVLFGKYLLFNSPVTGIDNIHALDLETKKRYKVTNSVYGAYNPAVAPDGKQLYYNEQTRDGFDVVRMPFDADLWEPLQSSEQQDTYYSHLQQQEGKPDLFSNIPQKNYEVARFKKWKHVVNPFSWGIYIDNDLANLNIGVTSRDILNTTEISAGYNYDINEQAGYWKAGVSYQGLYPIIDAIYTQGDRSVNEGPHETVVVEDKDTTAVLVNDAIFKWKEKTVSAGLRIPLTLTNGKYSSAINLANYFGMTMVEDFDNGLNGDRFYPTLIVDGEIYGKYFYDYVSNGTLLYNYANISAYRLLKRSHRDIRSRWGQTLNLRYYSTPYGGDYTGGVASALSYLYFPGVARHHSFYVYGAYQHHMNAPYEVDREHDYYFRNTVPIPRGFSSLPMFQDYYGGSVNYTLPIWYPDIALGPIFNLQRFRLNLFADYGYGDTSFSASKASQSYTSVGGELNLDLNFMRLLPQFDLGFRFSYGIDPEVQKFELVIGTINF